MRFGTIFISSLRNSAFVMMLSLILPLCVAVAAPETAGATDFEIPISELNKVKKKTPVKRTTHESKRKNRKDSRHQDSSASKQISGQSPLISEFIQIHHSPYSFVIADKQIFLHAVISSKSDIREVLCNILTDKGESQTQIKMTLVSGTQFTYTAALPALTTKSPALRYSIIAADTLGRRTRSQDFVTPVTSSSVVPLWQQENTTVEISPKVDNLNSSKSEESEEDDGDEDEESEEGGSGPTLTQ